VTATHPTDAPPIALDRRVPFELVFNARDLGGLPTEDGLVVRRGMVFRADGVHRLSGADLDVARALGLRTVIDLRTAGEVDRGRFPEALGVDWYHLPLIEQMWSEQGFAPIDGAVPFLRDRYLDMLVDGRSALARIVRLVGEGSPTLFHCAAGKDRTGVVAALLLGLLGVPPEVIAEDYHLSAASMQAMTEWLTATYPDAVDAMTSQPPEYLEAPVEAMLAFLEAVDDRHGSMLDLAHDLGVDDAMVATLRDALLEPATA
jgi:protein-tyrosine phosphatase